MRRRAPRRRPARRSARPARRSVPRATRRRHGVDVRHLASSASCLVASFVLTRGSIAQYSLAERDHHSSRPDRSRAGGSHMAHAKRAATRRLTADDPRRAVALLFACATGFAASRAAAVVCTANDFCSQMPSPCTATTVTVSGTVDVGHQCTLDFSTPTPRDVTVLGTLQAAESAGTFEIKARRLTLDGGKLKALGSGDDSGGDITATVTDAFLMKSSGALIDVSGRGGGGGITVTAGTIEIQSTGKLDATGTAGGSDGGAVTLSSRGSLLLLGDINVNPDSGGGGGTVELDAVTGLTIEATSAISARQQGSILIGDFPGPAVVRGTLDVTSSGDDARVERSALRRQQERPDHAGQRGHDPAGCGDPATRESDARCDHPVLLQQRAARPG